MTHPRSALLVLLALAMVATACTGGGDPDGGESATPSSSAAADPSPGDPPADEDAPTGAGGTGAGAAGIALAPGAEVDVEPAILESVATWIETSSGLTAMLREEIFLSQVTRTRDVLHLLFVQQHGEVTVQGAQFVVHVRDTGEVVGASTSLTETLPGEGTTEELTADAAVEIAEKSVPGTISGPPQVTATWVEVGTELRLGWDVQVPTADPPSSYSVVVDATTGDVLTVDRLATDHGHRAGGVPAAVGTPTATVDAVTAAITRTAAPGAGSAGAQVAQAGGCDAPPAPSACIFVVDPIYASGQPTIDPSQANATLVGVPLDNLLDPSGSDLIGRYAQISPTVADSYRDPDGVHGQLGRGGQDITFEAGMAYYWIDYTQQVVQEMGFDYHAADPVDFVPIEPEFPDNAFYTFVEDRIHMGIGGDGVNEAEDAQGIIHEYGHALLQWAVPDIRTEEGVAVHEGFSDLVSVFTTIEFRNGDIGCLFHWADRGGCIRRIDGDLVYPDDLRFEVHLDGEIYSGAIYEVFVRVLERETGLTPEDCQDRQANPCDAVRDDVYATLLGSLPFLTPVLDINDATAAFAASDQVYFAGRNGDIIAEVFSERGLAAASTPAMQIEGMPSGGSDGAAPPDPDAATASVKIRHAYRGDLAVRLDVIDAAGAGLCSADLISPDPADDGDNVQGRFPLDGSGCEGFLPPGPDQVWLLTVTDTLPEDEGTLFQFSINHDRRRFLASGVPAVIPDADRVGVTVAIGGEVPATTPAAGDAAPVPPPPSDGPAEVVADITIDHTYVGDLQIAIGVIDTQAEEVVCRVDVRAPDPQDDGDAISEQTDVSECAAFYPPSAQHVWALGVADLAAEDVGQVTRFSIVGSADGVTREADVPVDIPDADQSGVLVPIAG